MPPSYTEELASLGPSRWSGNLAAFPTVRSIGCGSVPTRFRDSTTTTPVVRVGSSAAETHNSVNRLPGVEERQALELRLWHTVMATGDLQVVVQTVADLLSQRLDFQGFGANAFEPHKGFRLVAAWNATVSLQPGQSLEELHRRASDAAGVHLPARRRIPYDEDLVGRIAAGEPVSSGDLFAKEAWYEYEYALAASGILAYTSIPAFVAEELVGLTVFCRRHATAFTADETKVFTDITRPIGMAIARVLAHEEAGRLRDELRSDLRESVVRLGHSPFFGEIVGTSLALRRALEAIEQVAPTDATVLISGETGTGKELLARAVHQRSRRAAKPFVEINCAAIPETLLASELFGHERGAFTGAHDRRCGRFEQADGGTLFLDEIGELTAEMQVLLLRVLQTREVQRLGGSSPVRVDVRIVAATNRNLTDEVNAGRFRSDLFHRLNVFPLRVPALRERPEDIGMLTAHFAAQYASQFGRTVSRIDRRTLAMLKSYDWPGNVRELENLVARAVIVADGEVLRIPRHMFPGATATGSIDARLQGEAREAIEAALRASRGRVAGPEGAAARLGLAPSTLESRLQRLGIDKHKYRSR
jgi:formate hydrogenlyase transcriptional activator